MRFAWLCSLAVLSCSSSGFNGDAGDDGGSGDAADTGIPVNEGGNPGDGGTDAGKPIHRLFAINSATSESPLIAWDDADTIAADRKPDVVITGPTNLSAITLVGNRLFVFDRGPGALLGFDMPGALTASSMASMSLGSSAFVGNPTPVINELVWNPASDILLTIDGTTSAVQMALKASTLKNGDMMTARFGSANEPFGAAVIDGMDRLFVAESAQQVIRYATGASTKTGTQQFTMDFGGAPMNLLAMVADSTRLYAGGQIVNGGPVVAVYNLSSINPGKTPDVLLSGLPSQGVVLDLQLVNDVLAVAVTDKVLVYTGAKSLTASSPSNPVSGNIMETFKMRISAKTGLLYTLGQYNGNRGLQVWKNITSAPTLQAELRTLIGTYPAGLAIYEP